MTTRTDDTEIEALPAREIHVAPGPAGSERPVMLTIGVYGRNGRGGSAHGVLLTKEGALLLLGDLADALGLPVLLRRALLWARRRAAHRAASRALAGARAGGLTEGELLHAILSDQVPAQRTASQTPRAESDPDTSPTPDTPPAQSPGR